jgi:FKBP-type peptidyl-prolyl cis-trans isomerase
MYLLGAIRMSDRPNPEQMAKVIVPALAVSAVIVIVGVLIAYRNTPDRPAPNDSNSASKVPPPPGEVRTTNPSTNYSIEGTSLTLPAVDAPDWKDAGEGLKIWDVKEGEGNACRSGAKVLIHYTGWTLDGKIFDSSVQSGQVADFPLPNLIGGWQRGIPGMKPGGIRRLYIPWPMAYGASGKPPTIPPKADLIFEIKLFSSQ